eukprot:5208552-Prorocentrum_lima.AAC.1
MAKPASFKENQDLDLQESALFVDGLSLEDLMAYPEEVSKTKFGQGLNVLVALREKRVVNEVEPAR